MLYMHVTGYYCGEYNLTDPTGPCDAGYYCDQGADVSNFIVCPAGSYCGNGSATFTPCPEGALTHCILWYRWYITIQIDLP